MAIPEAIKPVAKFRKVRVQATTMIWNGRDRIRQGTVFDYQLEEGKKLPRCMEEVETKEAEPISIGKRERDSKPSNMAKDAPGRV